MLDVPVTIETGDLTKKNHFYDPKSRFDYPSATYDYDALVTASEIGGDCQKIINKDDGESYKSCGHAILEIWSGFEEEVWSGFDESVQNALEPASTIGVVGEEKWFVPKYTAERDPTLLSYLGLQGLENRKKLADRFLRPTTWADYCNEVSEDGCLSGDGVAQRPPESEDEKGKYFSRELYTGHFRKVCNREMTIVRTPTFRALISFIGIALTILLPISFLSSSLRRKTTIVLLPLRLALAIISTIHVDGRDGFCNRLIISILVLKATAWKGLVAIHTLR